MTIPIMPSTAATSQRGVAFSVAGAPAPQGSKRAFVVGNRAVVTEDSKKSGPWRDSVAAAGIEAMAGGTPIDGSLEVVVTFRMPRPASVKRLYPSVKPDIDKLARAILDGLTAGGVIVDDSRVIDLHVRKRYTETAPGADVIVREVVAS